MAGLWGLLSGSATQPKSNSLPDVHGLLQQKRFVAVVANGGECTMLGA